MGICIRSVIPAAVTLAALLLASACGGSDAAEGITGVKLSKGALSLSPKGKYALTATVSPSNAVAKNVVWSCSDGSVAKVALNGPDAIVCAMGAGSATITARTADGAHVATCKVEVEPLAPCVAVAAGGRHSLALKADGSLWAWGDNYRGQLGIGYNTYYWGGAFYDLDGDGEEEYLEGWFLNTTFEYPVRVGEDSDWAAVSAGEYHTAALKRDGSLWTWGDDVDGQLGIGAPRTDGVFKQMSPVRVGEDSDWVAVDAGGSHTAALKADGSLWTWGCNRSGQIGDGTNTNRNSPFRVGADSDWSAVSAGGLHTFALKTDGSLWYWGDDVDDLVPYAGRNVPVRVGEDSDWATVSGGTAAFAIKTDGSLWAWGRNDFGQIGDGTGGFHGNNLYRTAPVRIGTDNDWAAASPFACHTAATKTDGSVWAWGHGAYGQIGDGTNMNRDTPVRVGADNDWATVSVGCNHTLAIKTDGSVWAWGYNWYSQLGDGSRADRSHWSQNDFKVNRNTPVQIGVAPGFQTE